MFKVLRATFFCTGFVFIATFSIFRWYFSNYSCAMDEQKQPAMQSTKSSLPGRNYENGNVSFQASEELITVKHQNTLFKEENEQMMSELAILRQRNLNLEEERVNMTSAFNKENMEKMTEIAKLQSQVEKGEAARQVLEYDFAVVKKKFSDTIRTMADKENLLAQETKTLSSQKSVLQGKMEDMEKALQIARRVTMEDEKRIAFLVDDKKQIESEKLASEAVLRSHHDKLAEEKAACVEKIKERNAKVKDLEKGLIKQEEELRKKLIDLQVVGEREQHMHSDLNELSHRCRALEESVEAERAAHLESKFNAEIIQLKQQETDTALNNEKELNGRLKQELQTVSKRYEDVVTEASAAREKGDAANQKMEKSMKLSVDLRKQLDEEIKEKNRVVKDLSSKISKHQESIDRTREELNTTKKKLIHIEEGYGGNMREVELLIETYSSIRKSVNKQATSKKKDKALSFEPHAIMDNLKKTFLDFRRTIDDLQRNLEENKSTQSQIQKDCNNFRDLALTREKSLQAAQQDILNCGMELNQIRVHQSDYERESDRLHRDLEEVTRELEEQTNRCKQLEENANSLMDRHRNENETHIAFLRELHHVLGNHAGRITSSRFTWSEFTVAVREGVDSLMSSLSREKEKSLQHETSCFQLEKTVGELQREHEASVDRLARQCREREEDALRQRKQLEEHYNALINELQGRAQKSQGLCDEAWERIRAGDGISEGLHAECAQLRGENSNVSQERKALASACALLFGALYPALRSRDELAKQRAFLSKSNEDSVMFKNQLRILVETLSEELQKPGENKNFPASSFRKIHPLIRFRVSAIAVLAANRLQTLARNSNATMFSCCESSASANRVLVVAGKSSRLIPSRDEAPVESHSDSAMMWLSDQRIVHIVRDSMCGLIDALDKNSGASKGYMSRAIVKTAKNSFLNILRQTHPMFSSVVLQSSSVVRERSSLVSLLSEGLARVIHKCRLTEVVKLQSVDHSLSILQRHLLNFTERLHAAEVEKRNLRNNENKLKAHIKQLSEVKSELGAANEEVRSLRARENLLVSKKGFNGVCIELNAALEREQQAQKLLHEQNAKLQELSAKLDEQCTEGDEKENTLSQAVNSLSDAKMELKRCAQSKRILSKQVSKLEQEKSNLGNKVLDAKEALKKAAREKDSLASYFQSVEKTLKKMPEDAAKLIDLPKGLSATKPGPDVIAAQRAVESFVHAQSSAMSRISCLAEQISDYRSHINSLKKELQDACRRDNGYVPISEMSHIPTHDMTPSNGKGGYMTDCSTPCDADFMPLRGVAADESSYSLHPYSKKQ